MTLNDPLIERLASLLVEYSLEIKPGDLFVIRGETTHEPLLRELYRLSVRIGAEPVLRISLPGQAAVFYTEASDDTLELPSRFDEFLDEHEAAELVLLGSAIPYALSGVDPARIVRHSNAHRDRMMRRTERLVGENADIRGCVSLLPIPSLAQAAKMSLTDYESFVYKAMHLFEPDPVQWWREFSEKQGKYCDFLNGVHDIRIVAEDTDLKINISNRKWINADGRFNFPDGEVYTSPVGERPYSVHVSNDTSGLGSRRRPLVVPGRLPLPVGSEDRQEVFGRGIVHGRRSTTNRRVCDWHQLRDKPVHQEHLV